MKKLIWLITASVLLAGFIWLVRMPAGPGELDAFAQCVSDSGAKYYGAFWCPNCKNQEAMFGRSARLLPRIECSTPDGRGQLPVCNEAGVEGYPTWEFADGTRVSGTQSLESLGEFTGCRLSEENG